MPDQQGDRLGLIGPPWAENMPRPDLIDEIETLRDALRSWQDAAAKASREVIAADERLRGAVKALRAIEESAERHMEARMAMSEMKVRGMARKGIAAAGGQSEPWGNDAAGLARARRGQS